MVSWLPLYHDMGLIGGLLQPVFVGYPCVLMSPRHFLERPVRWLEAISRYRGTISGGPDFAYRLCSERVPRECGRRARSRQLGHRLFRCRADPARHAGRLRREVRTRGLPGAVVLRLLRPGRGDAARDRRRPRQRHAAAGLRRGGPGRGIVFEPGDGAVLAGSGRPLPDHEVRVVEPVAAHAARGRAGSARSGSRGRASPRGTGASRRPRPQPSSRRTGGPGCAPAISAPCTRASSTSPAGSRTC